MRRDFTWSRDPEREQACHAIADAAKQEAARVNIKIAGDLNEARQALG